MSLSGASGSVPPRSALVAMIAIPTDSSGNTSTPSTSSALACMVVPPRERRGAKFTGAAPTAAV
eukprot:scaffold173516_cov27-Tisochrysis_lutea.AAC.9